MLLCNKQIKNSYNSYKCLTLNGVWRIVSFSNIFLGSGPFLKSLFVFYYSIASVVYVLFLAEEHVGS